MIHPCACMHGFTFSHYTTRMCCSYTVYGCIKLSSCHHRNQAPKKGRGSFYRELRDSHRETKRRYRTTLVEPREGYVRQTSLQKYVCFNCFEYEYLREHGAILQATAERVQSSPGQERSVAGPVAHPKRLARHHVLIPRLPRAQVVFVRRADEVECRRCYGGTRC